MNIKNQLQQPCIRELFNFDQIYYRLLPRATGSTTNFQGQRVKVQGHGVM